MNFDRSESIISKISDLRADYTKLTALRLAALAERMQGEYAEESEAAHFSDSWQLFSALKGGELSNALQDAALDSWIIDTNHLIATGAAGRCRKTHLLRTLARFSVILINSVQLARLPSASGKALLIGSSGIPIFASRALLRRSTPSRSLVDWTWSDGLLRITDPSTKSVIVKVSQRSDADFFIDGSWGLEVSQEQGNLKIFSAPLCGFHENICLSARFYEAFLATYKRLPNLTQEIFQRVTSAVAPRCDRHTYLGAGYISVASVTPAELLKQLGANIACMMVHLYEFRTGNLLTRDLEFNDLESLSAAIGHSLNLYSPDHPNSNHYGLANLEQMLCASGSPSPGAVNLPRGPSRANIVDFTPFAEAAGLSVGAGQTWCEQKVRHNSQNPLVKWRLINGLLDLQEDQCRRILDAVCRFGNAEQLNYASACVSYNEGNFKLASARLILCIDADPHCENYWLLLALCYRHLGDYESFNRIVFEGIRGDDFRRILETTTNGST